MGCTQCPGKKPKDISDELSEVDVPNPNNEPQKNIPNSKNERPIIIPTPTNLRRVSRPPTIVDESVNIKVADPQAFSEVFIQQRQQAIDNTSYRSVIESWQPDSLQHLADTIKTFCKGKSIIDRHWIIFYWVTFNIEYDTVSYFTKDYRDQSAEGVFQNKKGVCAGYANIYKYLCDEIELPCEVVGGYSKGYGFDDREGAPAETDHAWNVVEIYHHQYLMESTWGAGHLNDKKAFERKLDSYYFLPRPNEMIYHHLPEDEKWQLLETPIQMDEYMQMPHLRPIYFEFKLNMIQPRNQCFVELEHNKPYALVIMKTPNNIGLLADLKLHDQEIEGGHFVYFNKRKQLYYCYFAPANIGDHKITIYAKHGNTDVGSFSAVLDLKLKIKQMPQEPISYPKYWKCFYDFRLKLLSPLNTHIINLNKNEKYAQILIQAPSDIQLMGQIQNQSGENILCGEQVYYDRERKCWTCNFAPNKNGIFNALTHAKKTSDPGSYTSAIQFKINASQVPSPPFSFPTTWHNFYDLDLKILYPVGRGIIVLRNKTSCEIRIKTPDDVGLVSQLQNDNDEEIFGGNETYYDDKSGFWRCKFAPNENRMFNALILAKRKSDSKLFSSAVMFKIDATELSAPSSSLLKTTQLFHDLNLEVLSPIGNSKITLSENSSFAEICLKTPDYVELLGQLRDADDKEILYAEEVYYDRHKNIWRCKFAPNQNGLFNAIIMAKKKTDSGLYSAAVTFQIEANHIRLPPLTFPKTWAPFYDFDLKVIAPHSRSTAVWSKNASYAEILIQAPDDIRLSCRIEYEGTPIENGALAQYDHEKQLWQLLFAPEHTGEHQLYIFAKRIDDKNVSAKSAVMFPLNVTKISKPMKFPVVYAQFETSKCQIHTPLDGRLKKGSTVDFHCNIPGAVSVKFTIDAKTLKPEEYVDPIVQRQLTVGSEEVTICAKYDQNPHYTILIKYFVE
ncbi:unnamed protein product [Adineta steineri]|uniref:Transglutaminase-like domain-containing protein n=1 Tax=Adineta steineri TaxID=433720 RepID=A0A814FTA4_9BILA|nr:unnamed protein product [Adineta steineri]CAF3745073.1 unnamed protein product [Adineta steineri]